MSRGRALGLLQGPERSPGTSAGPSPALWDLSSGPPQCLWDLLLPLGVFSLQARIISWESFRGFGKVSWLVRMEGRGRFAGAVPLSHFHSPCY